MSDTEPVEPSEGLHIPDDDTSTGEQVLDEEPLGDDTPPEEQPPETTPPDSEEELTFKERYANLQKTMGRQSQELGELRKIVQTIKEQPAPGQPQATPEQLEQQALIERVMPEYSALYTKYARDYAEDDAKQMAWEEAVARDKSEQIRLNQRLAPFAQQLERFTAPQVYAEEAKAIVANVPGADADEVAKAVAEDIPPSQWQGLPADIRTRYMTEKAQALAYRKMQSGKIEPPTANNPRVVVPGKSSTTRVSPEISSRAESLREATKVNGKFTITEEQAIARAKGGA